MQQVRRSPLLKLGRIHKCAKTVREGDGGCRIQIQGRRIVVCSGPEQERVGVVD